MVEDAYKDDAKRIERDYVGSDSVTRDEIEQDLEDRDFNTDAIDDIVEWLGTREDVELDSSNAHEGGITTREDVRDRMRSDLGDKVAETRSGAIEEAVAREIGAPRERDLRAEQMRLVSAETVGDTPTSVVRDSRGNPVATIGGGSRAGPEVSEEIGAQRHYASPREAIEDMRSAPAPDGSSAAITLGDTVVGEVEI